MSGRLTGRRWLIGCGLLCLLLAIPADVRADDPQGDSEREKGRLERLLAELDGIVADITRDRTAQPSVLRELKGALARARRIRSRVLLSEGFNAGDLPRHAEWQVLQGSFYVDSTRALFTTVPLPPLFGMPATAAEARKKSDLRLVFDLMETLSGDRSGGADPGDRAAAADRAIVHRRVAVPNHFNLRHVIRSDSDRGALAIGLYQGTRIDSGYRLVHHADSLREDGLQLLRMELRGFRVLAATRMPEPGVAHAVNWRRESSGEMTVLIDGLERLRVRDTANWEPFSGVAIINSGGDHALDDLEIRSRE